MGQQIKVWSIREKPVNECTCNCVNACHAPKFYDDPRELLLEISKTDCKLPEYHNIQWMTLGEEVECGQFVINAQMMDRDEYNRLKD